MLRLLNLIQRARDLRRRNRGWRQFTAGTQADASAVALNIIRLPCMVVWHGMVKMTFSLDDSTADTLKRLSKRLQRPQSQVLREAISYYEPHAGKLTKAQQAERVALFDKVLAAVPSRPVSEVDAELKNVRQSRRTGWRRGASRSR